jgi:hypothetical protein
LAAASGFISGGFEGTKPEFSAGRAEESWKQQTNELIKRVSNFTEGSLAGYQEDSSSSALLFGSLQDGSGALDFSALAGKPGDWVVGSARCCAGGDATARRHYPHGNASVCQRYTNYLK